MRSESAFLASQMSFRRSQLRPKTDHSLSIHQVPIGVQPWSGRVAVPCESRPPGIPQRCSSAWARFGCRAALRKSLLRFSRLSDKCLDAGLDGFGFAVPFQASQDLRVAVKSRRDLGMLWPERFFQNGNSLLKVLF